MISTLASIVLEFSSNLYCFYEVARVACTLLRAIETIRAIKCGNQAFGKNDAVRAFL